MLVDAYTPAGRVTPVRRNRKSKPSPILAPDPGPGYWRRQVRQLQLKMLNEQVFGTQQTKLRELNLKVLGTPVAKPAPAPKKPPAGRPQRWTYIDTPRSGPTALVACSDGTLYDPQLMSADDAERFARLRARAVKRAKTCGCGK